MKVRQPRRVYFIKPVGLDGPIKIGCSQSPDGRLCTLETWSPFALEIVAEIDGEFDLERRFHAKFTHLHQRREWFLAGHDLTATIASINAGTFDVETLPGPVFVANWKEGRKKKRSASFGRQISYSNRVHHMERRTGFKCTVDLSGLVKRNDPAEIAKVEAYLADPVANGISPFEHLTEMRRKYPEWDWKTVEVRARKDMAAAGLDWPADRKAAA